MKPNDATTNSFKTKTQLANSTTNHSRTMQMHVLEYAGGALGQEPGLIDAKLEVIGVQPDAATEAQLTTAEATTKERVLAIGLLISSDCTR